VQTEGQGVVPAVLVAIVPGEAFSFAAKLAETFLDERAATARAAAFADLAVTGRMVYESFRLGVDEAQVKARVVELLNARDPVPAFTDMEVNTGSISHSNVPTTSRGHCGVRPQSRPRCARGWGGSRCLARMTAAPPSERRHAVSVIKGRAVRPRKHYLPSLHFLVI
jgi:hypothetical protein